MKVKTQKLICPFINQNLNNKFINSHFNKKCATMLSHVQKIFFLTFNNSNSIVILIVNKPLMKVFWNHRFNTININQKKLINNKDFTIYSNSTKSQEVATNKWLIPRRWEWVRDIHLKIKISKNKFSILNSISKISKMTPDSSFKDCFHFSKWCNQISM